MTMKVHANRDVCIGAGQCVLAAEDVFDQDDLGIVVLLDESPPIDIHEHVREAAKFCPVKAITLQEDEAE